MSQVPRECEMRDFGNCIIKKQSYISGKDKGTFVRDFITQDAVVRQLENCFGKHSHPKRTFRKAYLNK
jgi:uncharacterized protein with HEPN domain